MSCGISAGMNAENLEKIEKELGDSPGWDPSAKLNGKTDSYG